MNFIAEYPLKENGIGQSLIFIEESLKNFRMKQRDLLEALLISEETMVLLCENAPEDANIKIIISKKMGVPRIRMIVPGTPMTLDEHIGTISIDQLGENTENAIRSVMLRSYANSIKYRHSRSNNILTIVTGIPERLLATHTVAAMALAIVTAILFRQIMPEVAAQWILTNLLNPVESLFISALMCITAPAIFVSITCTMFRFEGISDLGQNGKTIMATYMITSVISILIGMLIFWLFHPGDVGILTLSTGHDDVKMSSILGLLATLVPPNIIEPFISVNSLQLTVIAMIIGAALTMSGKRVKHTKVLIEEMDVLCEKVASFVMNTAPVVVFCSTVKLILSAPPEVIASVLKLIPVLIAGMLAMLVFYSLILILVMRLNPIPFWKKYTPIMKNIFLKGSSVAAIPLNMRITRRQLGVPQNICSFTIPMGAILNMNGNCMILTIISMFFVRICGVSFGASEIIVLLALIMILSLGAPNALGVLILCMVTLMTQMGIDVSAISLIIGINFVLEMLLGMLNSAGDAIVAMLVAKKEGTLDLATYQKK